jgi:hypothetical protein
MGFELELDWHCARHGSARDRALEQRLARARVRLSSAQQACARLRDLPADAPERVAARLAYAQAAQRCRELEDALAGFADEPDGDERD